MIKSYYASGNWVCMYDNMLIQIFHVANVLIFTDQQAEI